MHALVVVSGSLGDLYPFLDIGRVLVARGHRVTICANEVYRGIIEQRGFAFAQTGSRAEFEEVAGNPDLWNPKLGFRTAWQMASLKMRSLFKLIEWHAGDNSVIIASSLASVTARLAQEKLGIPLVTAMLAPGLLFSARLPAMLTASDSLSRLPHPLRKVALWLIARGMLDRIAGPDLNRFRAELDLPPIRHIFDRWVYSPQKVLGMFPAWFAPPQTDWPQQVTLADFPLFDEAVANNADPTLEAFLADGPKPIVFTPGSAMFHGQAFFAKALEALATLGCRGIFLSRVAEHIPALPPTVLHVSYTSLTKLLPRAAALVHHGGIGTAAQALQAGLPQLITPFAHDQFDNAARVMRLHCGMQITADADAAALAAQLQRLLRDKTIGQACLAQRDKMAAARNTACEQAADAIESVHRQARLMPGRPGPALTQSITA